MIPVLSRSQMRAFDRYAIEECQVPGVVLMENAGRGAADVLSALIAARSAEGGPTASSQRRASLIRRSHFPTRHVRAPGQPADYPLDARVVVVCGTGLNGGDGFVVARHLLARGADVRAFLTGETEKVTGEARMNHDAFIDLGGFCLECADEAGLATLRVELARADFIVDALFGTGLDRPVQGHLLEVIHAINEARAQKLALDVPSGLHADSGAALGSAVRVDDTVTFGHLKVGLLTPDGARLAGRIHVVDLGVPDTKILEVVGHTAEVLDAIQIGGYFVAREPNVHKYAAGNVLVIAGSPGKLGAARLTTRAALRAGAGLVTLCTWPEAARALANQADEVMTANIDPDNLERSLSESLSGRHVVAIGPGFGLDEPARRAVDYVVMNWDGLKIIDADAITAVAAAPQKLARAPGRCVLTPHPGELGRLLGKTSAAVEQDRFGAVREAVALTRAFVVLKGARTIIGTPDGQLFVAMVGNPALATAGSGDVLTGLIAAYGCAMPPEKACAAGVFVHATAGDRWSEQTGCDRGLLAGELGDFIPEIVATLMRRAEAR